MKKLMIIGGGFAGFWSAISAIRQSREIQKSGDVEIIIITPVSYITGIPQLHESRLGEAGFELDKYFQPLGIRQVTGRAETIDPDKREVIVSTPQGIRNILYDYLILAAGASLKVPEVTGIAHTFNVDSPGNTQKLKEHILRLVETDFPGEGACTFIVVGSEVKGLETAISLEQKISSLRAYYPGKKWDLRIILLESSNEIGYQFQNGCKEYIQRMLGSKGIGAITNADLAAIDADAVLLRNGTRIASRTIIWTKGITASPLTSFFDGPKDDLNRLIVDQFLKFPEYNNVIAAGDVCNVSWANDQSSFIDAQYAQFHGRWAGHNAINDLFNRPMKSYVQPVSAACIDLGDPPFISLNEWERGMQERRNKERAAKRHMNTVTMFPLEDVEETISASYPEIPHFKSQVAKSKAGSPGSWQ